MIKYNDSDFKQIVTRSETFELGGIADIYKPYNEPMRRGNLYYREMDTHNVSYIQISSDLFLFTAIDNNNVYELISNGSDGVIGNGKCNPVVVNLSEQGAASQGLLPGNNEGWFTSESDKVEARKTEYVATDESIFNLKDDLEAGRLFVIGYRNKDEFEYEVIRTENQLISYMYTGVIYLKVEADNDNNKDNELPIHPAYAEHCNEQAVPKLNTNKVKYVKANYSRPSEAVRDLEDGAKFFCTDTGEHEITDPCDLLIQMKEGEVFIRVTVKWHDDVINYLKSFGGGECGTFIDAIGEHRATGINNHHFDGLVDMCRLIISNVDSEDSE